LIASLSEKLMAWRIPRHAFFYYILFLLILKYQNMPIPRRMNGHIEMTDSRNSRTASQPFLNAFRSQQHISVSSSVLCIVFKAQRLEFFLD